jgi:hypothetical protein
LNGAISRRSRRFLLCGRFIDWRTVSRNDSTRAHLAAFADGAHHLPSEKSRGQSRMAEVIKVGEHWAAIQTEQASGQRHRWTAAWAVYATRKEAETAAPGEPVRCLVSGGTATFDTEADARARAELDANRTAAVLSGTYRD